MSLAELSSAAHRRQLITAPLRVALIGCGAISEQMHLPVLAGWPGIKLAALVDRDLARAKRFAQGYGVGLALADASGLTREMVDAAIVATPPFHHAPCTLELIDKGIHVLVEKPMATKLADAEQMVAAADAAGVVLAVGFFRRLNLSIRLMKGLLDSGWAGAPERFLVEGGGMYNWPAATLGNMRRELAGGGVLIDFGSHMVDLMFALFDEPAEMLEYRDNALGGIESDCTIDVRVEHAGRPIPGRIELARTRDLGNKIVVECERAILEFQVGERFQIHVKPKADGIVDAATGLVEPFAFDAGWADGVRDESWYTTFGRQFDDWIGAIQAGREPMLSGRSALPTSRLIEACYADAKPMSEPWVHHGIAGKPEAAQDRAGSNGAVKRPAVHVAGRGEKILVTGASGFIGCRVAEILRLREKCDVRAAVHNPGNASRLARLDVDMVQADLSVKADAQRIVRDCDAIIHCAIGTSWGEPHKIASVTVGGTKHLAEAALASGARRFIHVSTMSVYGDDSRLTGVLDEDTPVRPVRDSIYGQTKGQAEQIALGMARRGLSSVVFRPARVFGPFSNIFITRPLRAIKAGNLAWIGSPDVPADMVYVDNVAEALLAATFADAESVTGQVFNISDGDHSTWREFYDYFATQLGLDLSLVGAAPPAPRPDSALKGWFMLPWNLARSMGQIITSTEFKQLGRRVLDTDPLGTLPRKALQNFSGLERAVRKAVGADDSLPIYHASGAATAEPVVMGSGGSVLSIERLKQRLNFTPPVSRHDSLQLTLDWVRHARIV